MDAKRIESMSLCLCVWLARVSNLSSPPCRCIICMIDFMIDDPVRFLPCMHIYHTKCIDDWLMRSFTCPTCMEPVDAALLSTYQTEQTDPFSVFPRLLGNYDIGNQHSNAVYHSFGIRWPTTITCFSFHSTFALNDFIFLILTNKDNW